MEHSAKRGCRISHVWVLYLGFAFVVSLQVAFNYYLMHTIGKLQEGQEEMRLEITPREFLPARSEEHILEKLFRFRRDGQTVSQSEF